MKLAGHVFLLAALLLVVTWLNVRSTDAEWRQAQDGLGLLDRFTLAESMLHRDLLTARAGLSLNYDLLVERLALLRHLVADIKGQAVGTGEREAVGRLAGLVDEEDQLTEQFKSGNALLHNSLAYFGLFTSHLSARDQPPELTQTVSGLSTAMLRLTLNSSSGTEDVDQWLRALSPAELRFPGSKDVGALVAHAQILRDIVPATDALIAELFAVPDEQALAAIRGLMQARQKASADMARLSQYLLYAISVLLVLLLGYLARGLQLRARALRRRMALEHVIAECSTGLITSSDTNIVKSVEDALTQLAHVLGADRAYFAFRDKAELHYWSRDGRAPPAGWISTAQAAPRQFKPGPADVVHLAVRDRDAGTQAFLARNGLQGWICAPSCEQLPVDAILGFDCIERAPLLSRGEVASLRMAFNAIANALNREVLQSQRRQLETSLHHARRIEIVGVLTSGIAHNFNNVIGSILGYSERASMRAVPGTQLADMIDNIHHAASRARDLIEQILFFGRRGAVNRARISVDALLAETNSLLKGSLTIKNELVIAQNFAGATVLGEAAQLQHVIVNLFVNAAHAMDSPDPVRLEVNARTLKDHRNLSQGKIGPGQYVVMSILDSGRGMDAETLARSFEPFFTTKDAGSGLGLATVREVVLEHGGAIDVCSELDRGTRFDVWLPVADGVPSLVEGTQLTRGNGETLLVVADQISLARTEEGIAALGYEPIGFVDVDAALRAHRHSSEHFDAVLLALGEPIEAALRTAMTIKQQAPAIPIVVAIANCSEYPTAMLAKAGIRGVLHYPISFSDLAAALARALAAQDTRMSSFVVQSEAS
jgi:signal transduction histidine kinase